MMQTNTNDKRLLPQPHQYHYVKNFLLLILICTKTKSMVQDNSLIPLVISTKDYTINNIASNINKNISTKSYVYLQECQQKING